MEMTLRDEVKFLRSKLYGLRKTYRRQVKDLNNALARERLAHTVTRQQNVIQALLRAEAYMTGGTNGRAEVANGSGPSDRPAAELSH